MTPHALDRPVWNSLISHRAPFALGGDLARRFGPRYGPLAGAVDASPEGLVALAALPCDAAGLLMLEADPVPAPPGMAVAVEAIGVQMVADRLIPADSDIVWVDLTDEDAAEMLALATLTQPGPFAEETHRLGQFIGVKQDGVLIAMAGERMRLPGYTEVSGVCTHPDHRGRGYAAVLMRAVMARILAAGETPFLHAYASNTGAIALYETLGFRVRRKMAVTGLVRIG